VSKNDSGIELGVTYAGAEHPFKQTYDLGTILETVKADVMMAFELGESTDAQGNQTVYRIYRGGERLDDLGQTVEQAATNKHHLQLRLVREVIAG